MDLLSAWRGEWPARPEVVVGLPAAGFPELTGSVVGHIAAAGRLPSLMLPARPPAATDPTSADEAAHWRDVLGPPEAMPAEVRDRVVLLVVDATSTPLARDRRHRHPPRGGRREGASAHHPPEALTTQR